MAEANSELEFVYSLVNGFDQMDEGPIPDYFIDPSNIVSQNIYL